MDKWDSLLVGDKARNEFDRPRACTAYLPRPQRHVFDQTDVAIPCGMGSPLSGMGSPHYHRLGSLNCSSPRVASGGVLACGDKQGTSGILSTDRGLVLQPASRGKAAVLWRPDIGDGVARAPHMSQQRRSSPCAGSASGQAHYKTSLELGNVHPVHQGAHTIEHRELWSRDDDPACEDLFNMPSARGNIPLLSRNCSEPGQAIKSPLKLALNYPPPLPLHDFSKDRHDALPQTGHLQLLPAPHHVRLQDAQAEEMLELSQESRAALREERKLSIAMRAEGHRHEEVFNSAKGRSIKLASKKDAEWRMSGSGATARPEPGMDAHHRRVDADDQPAIVRFMEPGYSPSDASDTTLVFESRFECGNLGKAYKIRENEYDLELSPDVKTRGHTQWFYFSVRNMRKDKPYIINITNFCKRDSLYSSGLRPLMYSESRAREEGQGWSRCGANICYFQNPKPMASRGFSTGSCGGTGHSGTDLVERHDDGTSEKAVDVSKREDARFTLSFEVVFPYDCDTVYLAHCFPFSYRDLQQHLDGLETDARRRKLIKRRVLTKTIADNDLEVLTITSGNGSIEEQLARPVIVMSARVHPGETNSSWMMKGILDFLTDPDDPVATSLCEMCEFRIVPMLNPDGVINGNYRCNLAGFDLNRHWKQPSLELHPTIFAHKNMVQQLSRERPVLLALDLHGHSCKRNVFIYGCHAKYWLSTDAEHEPPPPALHEQIYPFLLSQSPADPSVDAGPLASGKTTLQENESFSFKDCRFRVQRCKASSGRVVCWRECKIINSYTLEASFAGSDQGANKGLHFTSADLENMGRSICKSLHKYLQLRKSEERVEGVVRNIAEFHEGRTDAENAHEEDAENANDSSSDENIEEPVETFRARNKLRKYSKKAPKSCSHPPSDAEDTPVDAPEGYVVSKRPKESSKMIIQRLARPKRIAEKKDRVTASGMPWQTPNAYDEPRAPPRQFTNRVRQQLDMLTSLTATEAEPKREFKDPTTRRERFKKTGEKELMRSASDEPCRMHAGAVHYGSAQGEAETPERAGERGERGKSLHPGRRRRQLSRGSDGAGEDAGLDQGAYESGDASGQRGSREGDVGAKELDAGRRGRGRLIMSRGSLSDGQLCLEVGTDRSALPALEPASSNTAPRWQHSESIVGKEACVSRPGIQGSTAEVGEMVSPRGHQGRRRRHGSHQAPGLERSYSSEADWRCRENDLDGRQPEERPWQASDESEGAGDMDVGRDDKDKEGGIERKRALKKKASSKKKGGFSRLGSGGGGTKGR